jgi:hypothetical protein
MVDMSSYNGQNVHVNRVNRVRQANTSNKLEVFWLSFVIGGTPHTHSGTQPNQADTMHR